MVGRGVVCHLWAGPGLPSVQQGSTRFQTVTCAPRAPRPSCTGKGPALPAPTKAPPCALLACGWPQLAGFPVPGGVGTSVAPRPLEWPRMGGVVGWGQSWHLEASVLSHLLQPVTPFFATERCSWSWLQVASRSCLAPFLALSLSRAGRGFQGSECVGELGPPCVSLAARR